MRTIIKLLRTNGSNRRRFFHTNIVSREIIKPDTPTAPHLKTYNLSLLDQGSVRDYMHMLLLFSSTSSSHGDRAHEKARKLKSSLSKTISRHYPFAGRLFAGVLEGSAYVDCNDEGVEFFEACFDDKLLDCTVEHETLDTFLPKCREKDCGGESGGGLVMAQLNHFSCGGTAVAVSMSHKLGDASTLSNFIKHWASVTRFGSADHVEVMPFKPHFMAWPPLDITVQEYVLDKGENSVGKTFLFPNSKILSLKAEVKAMADRANLKIQNPTRVEVINSLLHKCAVGAAMSESNSGLFEPSILGQAVNMREKMVEPLPNTCVGNFSLMLQVPVSNESEIELGALTRGIQRAKAQFRGVKNWGMMIENLLPEIMRGLDGESGGGEMYICSSLCGFGLDRADFGWGKPIRAVIPGVPRKNSFVLMDGPGGDGIEALVVLEKQDMEVFENHEELLKFTD